MPYQATILGAGAAGLFAAGLLAQSGLRVLLLDHAPAPGRKILISGGGRANFTNLNTRPEHFLSENPHFAKSALARYAPHEFLALVERHGLAYHAKTPGQLFLDGSARQLVELLLTEAGSAELRLNTSVSEVRHTAPGFLLDTSSGPVTTETLLLATGGLSIPKLGATDFGYRIARQFGLRVVPPRPALVPFTFGEADAQAFANLAGVATEARVTVGKQSFQDKLLVTHRGLSGPAILQASSYWRENAPIAIDFAPAAALPALETRRDPSTLKAAWATHLGPARLAERLLALAPPDSWTNLSLAALEKRLHAWPLTPSGTEGYPKAEVTAGGVSTQDLHAFSLEARAIPGLYFIGELVDVTGHLGGFNFQWAWASAYAAAQAVLGRKGKG